MKTNMLKHSKYEAKLHKIAVDATLLPPLLPPVIHCLSTSVATWQQNDTKKLLLRSCHFAREKINSLAERTTKKSPRAWNARGPFIVVTLRELLLGQDSACAFVNIGIVAVRQRPTCKSNGEIVIKCGNNGL